MCLRDNLNLYCVYHKEPLALEYHHNKPWFESYYRPIIETKWLRPYYTQANHINSLDNLQKYFCEFTCLYYIYKNNIKSPYIGLCHYDRQYLRYYVETLDEETNINFNSSLMCPVCDWVTSVKWINEELMAHFLYDDLKEFIETHYDKNSMFYKIFITDYAKDIHCVQNMCFISKWEIFEKIIGFMVDFFDWHNEKNGLLWDEGRYIKYITDNFISKKDWSVITPGHGQWWLAAGNNRFRAYAYWCEFILGICLGYLIDNNITDITNVQ